MATTRNPRIERRPYGTTQDGSIVEEIILHGASGSSAHIITYGATLTRLFMPDRQGMVGDVVLGFDNLEGYEFESPYFGSTIGRVGNRIRDGRFTLDGFSYALFLNDGPNHLHGGFKGYDKRVWEAETAMMGGPSVRLSLLDEAGDEGYPGSVAVQVVYTLLPNDTLRIQYLATCDEATPINLTNHAYFNLKDAGRTPVYNHILHTNASRYTPVDETLVPTGEVAPVFGTPIDFTRPKLIGQDLDAMGGYDHNLVIDGWDGSLRQAAVVTEPETGRVMECWTTEPGVQFYSGNFLDGSIRGKDGFHYNRHCGFCLETQHFPDSINQPDFPDSILQPGEVYRQVTEYRFSAT